MFEKFFRKHPSEKREPKNEQERKIEIFNSSLRDELEKLYKERQSLEEKYKIPHFFFEKDQVLIAPDDYKRYIELQQKIDSFYKKGADLSISILEDLNKSQFDPTSFEANREESESKNIQKFKRSLGNLYNFEVVISRGRSTTRFSTGERGQYEAPEIEQYNILISEKGSEPGDISNYSAVYYEIETGKELSPLKADKYFSVEEKQKILNTLRDFTRKLEGASN